MENKESGFSTAFALTVIFSLCVITLSFAMIISADEKKINAYKKNVDERKEADAVILNIEKQIQSLKDNPSDADEYQIRSLVSQVCSYYFIVEDASTGINKNFISSEILENEYIRQYVLSNEEEAFREYGWINPKFAEKKVIDEISADFENKNTFPLVNNMPLLNIHFMSDSFIKAVLEYYKIKNTEQKIESIKQKLNAETTVKELSEILEVSETHSVFDLIGFKTVFWKIIFETDKYRCSTVLAAVPQKENQGKIEKYILVKKEIFNKGGNL